jgi:hypothetical protein
MTIVHEIQTICNRLGIQPGSRSWRDYERVKAEIQGTYSAFDYVTALRALADWLGL